MTRALSVVAILFSLNLFAKSEVKLAESEYIDGSFFEYVYLPIDAELSRVRIEAEEGDVYIDHCLITSLDQDNQEDTKTVHVLDEIDKNDDVTIRLDEDKSAKDMNCAIQSLDDNERGKISVYARESELKPPGPGPTD